MNVLYSYKNNNVSLMLVIFNITNGILRMAKILMVCNHQGMYL